MLDVNEDVYIVIYETVELFEYIRREQIYFYREALQSCDDILYVYDCLTEFNTNLHALCAKVAVLKSRVFIAVDESSRC